jgi:arginase
MGPAALRVARISQRISRLGYTVHDLGDMRLERPQSLPEVDDKLKYVREISNACEQLATEVKTILENGELPLVLGGDHSIAIGSFAGVVSYFKKQDQTVGLIWFDAHADMNTPESTPSGNIHGMPLASLLGYGTPELTNVAGFAPKLDPRLCAHVGARDIDPGERELIRKLGMRFFTMREIDERGMSATKRSRSLHAAPRVMQSRLTSTRLIPAMHRVPERSCAVVSRIARRISEWKRSLKQAACVRWKLSRLIRRWILIIRRRNSAWN